MKYYLAARYDRLDEMNGYASQLRELGHEVNCRWLLGTHQLHPNPQVVDKPGNAQVPMEAQPFALDDVEDVFSADALILFTEKPGVSNRGGRHVEFGLALGFGKPVAIIGPRENVFHCLPEVRQFESWPVFLGEVKP